MYVGNGTIAGFDIYGGRYKGTYMEDSGRFKGSVMLSMPGGGQLVTGQQVPPGQSIPVTVDWPANFGNGQPLNVKVGDGIVQVNLTKMVDF
jgi:hypothetical protein